MERIVEFLKLNQWSEFYQSLLAQYNTKGQLSERQVQAVENAILRAMAREAAPTMDLSKKSFSIKPGDVLEIKAWIARRLQADNNMQYFFRNLEVTEVKNETAKAFQVNVKFVSRIITSCHICGRELDTDVSRATGIGPVCADKLGIARPTLETAHQTLEAIDVLCKNLGTIGPIWLPKSQVKTVTGGNGSV